MAKKTIQQRLVEGLLALGYIEQKRTTHYRVFRNDVMWVYFGPAPCDTTGKVSATAVVSQEAQETTKVSARKSISRNPIVTFLKWTVMTRPRSRKFP